MNGNCLSKKVVWCIKTQKRLSFFCSEKKQLKVVSGMCQGLNSHSSANIGDNQTHQPNSLRIDIPIIRISHLKVGWPFPNIRSWSTFVGIICWLNWNLEVPFFARDFFLGAILSSYKVGPKTSYKWSLLTTESRAYLTVQIDGLPIPKGR